MRRIHLLDYARLFAAVSVMCFHYLFNGINNGKVPTLSPMPEINKFAIFGYLGVDFFFIISGFVISMSYSGKTAGDFVTSRMVRMIPAFWTGIGFTTFIATFYEFSNLLVSPLQSIANLTFIPQLFGYDFVDGVYWTLQYELAFYGLIFALLWSTNSKTVDLFLMAWPWIMAAALAFNLQKLPFLGGYFTYFAAGAVLARLSLWRLSFGIPTLALSITLSVNWAVTKSVELAAQRHVEYPPLVITMIVLLMFAFFLVLQSERVSRVKLPAAVLAGGLTYPLYLVHAHFGYMLLTAYGTDENKAWLIPLLMVCALCVAFAIHVLVERSMKGAWFKVFDFLVGRPVDAARWALQSRLQRGPRAGV